MAKQPESSGGKSFWADAHFPDSFECPAIGKYTQRLGLCVAHRVAMGICLSCRHDHGILMATPSLNANYNWDGGANDGSDLNKLAMWGNTRPHMGFFDMHGNVWE